MLWVGFIFWNPSVLGSRFYESDTQPTLSHKVSSQGGRCCTSASIWLTSIQRLRCNLLKKLIFFKFNLNSVSTCNWTSDSPSLTPPQRYSGNTHWGCSYSESNQSRLFWVFESPSGNGPLRFVRCWMMGVLKMNGNIIYCIHEALAAYIEFNVKSYVGLASFILPLPSDVGVSIQCSSRYNFSPL